ncbi:MAG: CBS domain-containing protein [Chloroflexi bacterium]|nr:CBS domain-containing protein [Chloroflexota bacterium]
MLVKDYMTRHPIMISPDTSAAESQQIMTKNNIRHLPVIGDGKRILGLISRERLRIPPTDLGSLNVWEISRYLNELRAKDVMVKKKDLITIEPDATMEDAAKKMIDDKVGCLLVIEEDIVVGIITEIDMLIQLNDILGGNEPGVRITIRVPNVQGELAKIASAISDQGWGIYASGGLATPKDPSHWDVVLKVRNVKKEDLVAVLEKIEGQEIIDVR